MINFRVTSLFWCHLFIIVTVTCIGNTPTLAPSKPCQNILSFQSTVGVAGGPIGNCFNFSFSLNAGTLQLCGWNTTTGKPAMLWNKNQGWTEQGIGLENNLNHEIPMSGMIQINMRDIKTKTIPTFNIGSTGSTNGGATGQNSEWYCLYGSNAAGVLGTTLLYSNYIEAQDFLFPATYVNYKFISFTSCPSSINSVAAPDILIQTITITDGFACTSKPSIKPTNAPTQVPTSAKPSYTPSCNPTVMPTYLPSMNPTYSPTFLPSFNPSLLPTAMPSIKPTPHPSVSPTASPTYTPSAKPTSRPSISPTSTPTYSPSVVPTFKPTVKPSTLRPSVMPTYKPTTVGNIAVTQCALYQNPFNDASFQGFIIVHQTLSNTNASELSSTPDAIASFIQAVQCSMSGVFALRTVNVTITEIKAVTSTTQTNLPAQNPTNQIGFDSQAVLTTAIKYVVEFSFPLSQASISQPDAYIEIQQYFNGLVAQMTDNVNQGKFSSIFQQYLLISGIILKPSPAITTITPQYFGPYLKTIVPSLAPVESTVQTAGVATTTQVWSQWAVIIGTVSGVLCIVCSLLSAYYYYIVRKRTREEEMDKWTANNLDDIQIFKKYNMTEENPAFGQNVMKGRNNNVVNRAIDAVKLFSIRTSMRLTGSPVGATGKSKPSGNSPMDIEINSSRSNYSNRSVNASALQNTKYYASSKSKSHKYNTSRKSSRGGHGDGIVDEEAHWTDRNSVAAEYLEEEDGTDYAFGSYDEGDYQSTHSGGFSLDRTLHALGKS